MHEKFRDLARITIEKGFAQFHGMDRAGLFIRLCKNYRIKVGGVITFATNPPFIYVNLEIKDENLCKELWSKFEVLVTKSQTS